MKKLHVLLISTLFLIISCKDKTGPCPDEHVCFCEDIILQLKYDFSEKVVGSFPASEIENFFYTKIDIETNDTIIKDFKMNDMINNTNDTLIYSFGISGIIGELPERKLKHIIYNKNLNYCDSIYDIIYDFTKQECANQLEGCEKEYCRNFDYESIFFTVNNKVYKYTEGNVLYMKYAAK